MVDETKQDPGFGVAQNPATNFRDVFSASLESTSRNYLFNSKEWGSNQERSARDKRYKELTGRDLYEDAFQSLPNATTLMAKRAAAPDKAGTDEEVNQAVNAHILKLKAEDPERFREIYNSSEIDEKVKQKAKDSLAKTAKAQAGASGFAGMTGNLAGGLVASFKDPLNLATLPIGAGATTGIIKGMLIEGMANMGAELASYPQVASWQKELGQEYGIKELGENMAFAGLFGSGFHGLLKGAGHAKSLLMGRMAEHFDDINNPLAAHAAKFEERRLHVEESNVTRLGHEDPAAHAAAIREVDAALNEGRALNAEKIPLTDEQIRGLDHAKMDENTAAVHERLTEDTPAVHAAEDAPAIRVNEALDNSRAAAPNVERQKQLADLYDSPERRAAERAEFDSKFSEQSDTRIFGEAGDADDMSPAVIKKLEQEAKDYISAITSCGLGAR